HTVWKAGRIQRQIDSRSYEVQLDSVRQNRLFGKNSGLVAEKYSVATQIAIGGASGWCAGYLIHGYIQVDWKRVEKDVSKAKKQLKKGTNQAVPEFNTLIKGQCYIFQ
uniref:FUN14 domain-containing protein 2 n=1 Tax=Gouania willdenowi TaxID=441366 RepID=A0A8C5HYY2_GOUWI